MNAITSDRFEEYFSALHGHGPYPWQRRLAERAVAGDWPAAIDLPTGSGKTACLDVTVFALACQATRPASERSAARRIFFCVNRRVIVDEAYTRARRIAATIWKAEREGDGILAEVAAALRQIGGTAGRVDDIPPLDALELRGGIYRDNRWARSLTQPTIVCTTLDQLGSRLLFRGYGVSNGAAPIHAALVAYDSLILLDEAHISEPFRQTLTAVRGYLDPERWAERPVGMRPLTVVPMTATPPGDLPEKRLIRLDDDDRSVEALAQRLAAAKLAELRPPAKNVAKAAVDAALTLGDNLEQPAAIGIIVNRVATARTIHAALCEQRDNNKKPKKGRREVPEDTEIHLVIGSMRPIDRDGQARTLDELVGPKRPTPHSQATSFVVATQCLEVGADYDFDLLVTECASLDALRQRFGRLNRAGREIAARAAIVIDAKAVKTEADIAKVESAKDPDKRWLDPIYGNAQARTWNWLHEHAAQTDRNGTPIQEVDFGIDAFCELLKQAGEAGHPPKTLLAPSASLHAPVMMPAYIDCWCQTNPRPVPDPNVSLFIHGEGGGEPDVQVCWRADLIEDDQMQPAKHWRDVVSLMPPTSAECMRIPLSRLRRWLNNGSADTDDTGDVLGPGKNTRDDDDRDIREIRGVLWRGSRNSKLLTSVRDLKPGDTVVFPAHSGATTQLGHFPERSAPSHAANESPATLNNATDPPVRDRAEAAFLQGRDRAALRLHLSLGDYLGPAFAELVAQAGQIAEEQVGLDAWRRMLAEAANKLTASGEPSVADPDLRRIVDHLQSTTMRIEPYPDERGVVLMARKRIARGWAIPATDDGNDDTSSLVQRDQAVTLDDHCEHVAKALSATTGILPLAVDNDLLTYSAKLHDYGKADERFQAMLRRNDRTDAWLWTGRSATHLAKSDGVPLSRAAQTMARKRAGLPEGFRHEMLSAQIAEHDDALADDPHTRELTLHLIAAHHGHARPFAPVVEDDELPTVEVGGICLPHEQRAAMAPPHRLDSGVAERFWRLTRRYGWWGLAYLEAVLRLADQQASADEEAGRYDQQATSNTAEATA